jgi:hypothetical protein
LAQGIRAHFHCIHAAQQVARSIGVAGAAAHHGRSCGGACGGVHIKAAAIEKVGAGNERAVRQLQGGQTLVANHEKVGNGNGSPTVQFKHQAVVNPAERCFGRLKAQSQHTARGRDYGDFGSAVRPGHTDGLTGQRQRCNGVVGNLSHESLLIRFLKFVPKMRK